MTLSPSTKPASASGIRPSVLAGLSNRSWLVDFNTTAFLRGIPRKTLLRLVDGGNFQQTHDAQQRGFEFVFNLATNPKGCKRDLRFWTKEFFTPEVTIGLSLARVIDSILPPARKFFSSGEVLRIFQWGHANLSIVKKAGQLPIGSATPRAALVRFLSERWLNQSLVRN